MTRKVRDHSPTGAQLPGRADVPAGPEYLRSGYYSWRSRPESATTTRRRRLALFIRTEFSASDGTYGYRRITAALWRRGVVVDRDTVRTRHA